jgi:general secretion pathway protein J
VKARRRARGFTLIEIMVASVLLATVATIIMGSFRQSFRVRDHTAKVFDRYKDVRLGMHRMAREISMAYLSLHHNAQEATTSTWFEGDRDELHFTAFANLRMVRDVGESDQAEIGYFVERGETMDGRRVQNLMRRIDSTMDSEALKGGYKMVMVEDVERIEFEYWDATKEIGEQAWTDEWEAGQKGQEQGERGLILPTRVRITLTVNGVYGKPLKFSTQASIMVLEALDF